MVDHSFGVSERFPVVSDTVAVPPKVQCVWEVVIAGSFLLGFLLIKHLLDFLSVPPYESIHLVFFLLDSGAFKLKVAFGL